MLLLVIVLLPMVRWSVNIVVIRVNERVLAGTVSLLICLDEIFHDVIYGEETSSGTESRDTPAFMVVSYKLALAVGACRLRLQGLNHVLLQLLTFNTHWRSSR